MYPKRTRTESTSHISSHHNFLVYTKMNAKTPSASPHICLTILRHVFGVREHISAPDAIRAFC